MVRTSDRFYRLLEVASRWEPGFTWWQIVKRNSLALALFCSSGPLPVGIRQRKVALSLKHLTMRGSDMRSNLETFGNPEEKQS